MDSLRCIPANEGLVLLGTPIGSSEYVTRQCLRLVEAVIKDMGGLAVLEDHPQAYYLLLRHCFNARPQYLARTVRPDLLLRAAKMFDHHVNRRIAEPLSGLRVGAATRDFENYASAFKRARLPYALGGLQIPSLQMTSRAAYLSALAVSWGSLPTAEGRAIYNTPIRRGLHRLLAKAPFVGYDSAEYPTATASAHRDDRVRAIRKLFPRLEKVDPALFLQRFGTEQEEFWAELLTRAGEKKDVQKLMTGVFSSHAFDALLKALFPPQHGLVATRRSGRVAKFLSGSCRQAVEFTRVVPSSADLLVPREEYFMALAYLLHLPVPGRALLGENCMCSRPRLDPLGHHIVRCWQHRTVPHDVLCRKLHAMCRSAGLAARLEPTNCLTNLDAGSQDRPDIAIEGLAPGGRVLLVDATTADPSAVTTINTFKSHRIIGAAAEAGARRKRAQYHGHYNQGQFTFRPLALELPGHWGKDFTGFFDDVCKKARELHGLNATRYGYFVSYWRSRLSVLFTRSLARQAVNTKKQIYQRSQSTVQLEPVELARTF